MERVTGTATLDAKLIQPLAVMREAILHTIFLNPKKAYDTLDRDRRLDILAGYGVGTRPLQLLHTYRDWLQMLRKAGGYLAPPLQGIKWGDTRQTFPPTIFNVMADSVI